MADQRSRLLFWFDYQAKTARQSCHFFTLELVCRSLVRDFGVVLFLERCPLVVLVLSCLRPYRGVGLLARSPRNGVAVLPARSPRKFPSTLTIAA